MRRRSSGSSGVSEMARILAIIREYKDGGWYHIFISSPWGRGGEIWEGEGEWDSPALRDLAMILMSRVLQGDLAFMDLYQAGIKRFTYDVGSQGDYRIHTLSLEGDFPPPEELARIFQR